MATEKLKRKDVLKLIDNLTSGQYLKGQGQLVSPDGMNFCCLGVWADQHGCVWHKMDGHNDPIPSMPNKKPPNDQRTGSLVPKLSFGLTTAMQGTLAELNDEEDTWQTVLHYLTDVVLPKTE